MKYVILKLKVYVLTVLVYFCEWCFKFVHEKSCNDHKKEEIDYLVPIDLKCPEHPKNIINLFCVEERGN